jgi:hypothetical protein
MVWSSGQPVIFCSWSFKEDIIATTISNAAEAELTAFIESGELSSAKLIFEAPISIAREVRSKYLPRRPPKQASTLLAHRRSSQSTGRAGGHVGYVMRAREAETGGHWKLCIDIPAIHVDRKTDEKSGLCMRYWRIACDALRA